MLNIEKYENELRKSGVYFALTKEGKLVNCEDVYCVDCAFCKGCSINRMNWLLEEYKEPILTDKDKIIIKDIIKAFEPFGKELSYITKERWNENCCYLIFKYGDDNSGTLTFNSGKLFVGMELDKDYTPEELDL